MSTERERERERKRAERERAGRVMRERESGDAERTCCWEPIDVVYGEFRTDSVRAPSVQLHPFFRSCPLGHPRSVPSIARRRQGRGNNTGLARGGYRLIERPGSRMLCRRNRRGGPSCREPMRGS
eukprot:1639226-Rhodomonas_salina.1